MAILFVASWIILLILAVRLIARGWSAATDLGSGKFVESSRTVTRPPHPEMMEVCLLYTSPSPRDRTRSRMPSSA